MKKTQKHALKFFSIVLQKKFLRLEKLIAREALNEASKTSFPGIN